MAIFAFVVLAPVSASAHTGEHVIENGDTLSKIATEHQTTWERLWYKNLNISNPDLIFAGNTLTVPDLSEELAPRGNTAVQATIPAVGPTIAPTPPPAPVVCREDQWVRADNGQCLDKPRPVTAAPAQTQDAAPAQTTYRGSGGPNNYGQGFCTWYVKTRRPDIGGNWGNANQWLGSAQAAGYATGSAPRAGAIGVNFDYYLGHVVYVESVNGNGTVTVSEMNYQGWGVVSSRTTSASEFVYIYN